MDVLARFLDECCVLEPDAFVSRADFNRRYVAWCRDTGIRYPLGSREIAARLKQRECGQRIVRGSRQWTGIRTMYALEDFQSTQ